MQPAPVTEAPLKLSRRELIARSSVLVAGSLLARSASYASAPPADTPAVSPVMETLSAYMAAAATRALPAEVLERAREHILDTLAAMLSGAQLPPGRAALAFAQTCGGPPTATVAASRVRCGAFEAAMLNGVLAHSDETDDSNSPSQSHPGCAVVPAALAAGEKFGISGAQFVRAVTLGYDVGCRMGITLGAVNYQTETRRDPHAISEGFGAAAAAACAASLNAQQMRFVLDYASQQSSGYTAWQRDTRHFEKAFVFAGMPARNGVTSAMLVKAGWSGVDDVFSGPGNFFSAYAPAADPHKLVDALGERYEIARTNIKKWSVGSPIQAALDAVQMLLAGHRFSPEQVQHVIVRVATREASIVDNRSLPDICLQHLVALMLVRGTITFRSAHDQALMQDPAVLRERAKVTLVPDEELEKRLPAREATVEILLQNGTMLRQHVTAVRGTAENPMSRTEIVAKSRDLIEPVLGEERSQQLIASVLTLDSINDVRDLTRLLRLP